MSFLPSDDRDLLEEKLTEILADKVKAISTANPPNVCAPVCQFNCYFPCHFSEIKCCVSDRLCISEHHVE